MARVQIHLEELFKSSPKMLYQFITDPACLVRWFCNSVDVTGQTFTFEWEGSEEIAELTEDVEDERLRFIWEDGEDGEFLEFKLSKSPITGETILEITDYCDDDEIEDTKQLWTSQITAMKQEMGIS